MLDYFIEDCEGESCRGFDGEMNPLTKTVETILRKSGEPLTVYIYETKHGLLELADPHREGLPSVENACRELLKKPTPLLSCIVVELFLNFVLAPCLSSS
jgi:hypothetical protein